MSPRVSGVSLMKRAHAAHTQADGGQESQPCGLLALFSDWMCHTLLNVVSDDYLSAVCDRVSQISQMCVCVCTHCAGHDSWFPVCSVALKTANGCSLYYISHFSKLLES